MSCFLPPELWIVEALWLKHVCSPHLQSGINLKPYSYSGVCWNLQGENMDEVCWILPLLCRTTPVHLRSSYVLISLQLHSDAWQWKQYWYISGSLSSVCIPVWYLLVIKTWREIIRTVGFPGHSHHRYHSSRLEVASSAFVICCAFGSSLTLILFCRNKSEMLLLLLLYISNTGE